MASSGDGPSAGGAGGGGGGGGGGGAEDDNERLEGDSVAFRPVSGRKGLYVKAPSMLRRAA